MTINTSLYNLGDVEISTAATYLLTPIDELGGMARLSIQVRFSPQGVTGSAAKAYIQGSGDQGTTWHDLACAAFTSAGTALLTLEQGAAAATLALTDTLLTDNTALNSGIVPLFDRLQMKVVTTGTWGSGSLISGRVQVT